MMHTVLEVRSLNSINKRSLQYLISLDKGRRRFCKF
jgi:hypothetical protein